MGDFNEEIDEYMWMCDRLKTYKSQLRSAKMEKLYIHKDIWMIIKLSYSQKLSRLDVGFLNKKIKRERDLDGDIELFEGLIQEIMDNLDHWSLDSLFGK